MPDDYTPDTQQIRHSYADYHYPVESPTHAAGLVEFDRWLAATIRQAKAQALTEAALRFDTKGLAVDLSKGPFREGLAAGWESAATSLLREAAKIAAGGRS